MKLIKMIESIDPGYTKILSLNKNIDSQYFGSPWTARRYNQSILKEISPEYSLEGLILWPSDTNSDAGKD